MRIPLLVLSTSQQLSPDGSCCGIGGWIVLHRSTTPVLEIASSRVMAGLCFMLVQHEYWKCLLSGAGWIVLHRSATLVLEMPPFGCRLDCASS